MRANLHVRADTTVAVEKGQKLIANTFVLQNAHNFLINGTLIAQSLVIKSCGTVKGSSMKGCSHNRAFYGKFMSESMNKYHKRSELDKSLPGWVKVGALAVGVGVGGPVPVPGGQYARAEKIKENTERTHTTTVNVALQNRCLNFENANFFLPKTLFFVLPAVALLYFMRKKSKSDNNR